MKIYNVNGTEEMTADISKIVIYGHGVKLYETRYSEIKACEISKNRFEHDEIREPFGSELYSITLAKPVKRANKENLNRADNYTLNYKEDYCRWETRKALYIHESEIAVTDMGLIVGMETNEERNYLKAARLSFKHPIARYVYHLERIPCGDDWTIPDGGKWSDGIGTKESPCYRPYDMSNSIKNPRNEKGVIKSWKEIETVENAEIIVKEDYYRKTEYSAERLRKNAIAEAINNAKVFSNYHVSHYDIERLEKVVNITLK